MVSGELAPSGLYYAYFLYLCAQVEIDFKECSLAFRHASCGLKLGNQKVQTNEVHCLAFQYNNTWYAILIILFLHLWCQF